MPKRLPPIPARETLKFHKTLSIEGLLKISRKVFNKIPEHRTGKFEYSLPDVLMSAFSVFGLKFPSLLQFDKQKDESRIRYNLRALYDVIKAPSDTQMREVCDDVNPEDLRPAFTEIINQAHCDGALDDFVYLDGAFLLSVDGTGHFSSSSVCCPECCEKHRRDGTVEYYRQLLGAAMAHPDKKQVFPLFPEAITRQDGTKKNDCERNAGKRLLPAIHEALPTFKFIVLEDALAANAPHIKMLKSLGYSFIITAKQSDLPVLFEHALERLSKGEGGEFEETGKDGVLRGYRFINGIPLNKASPDILVNYPDYWEERNGKTYNIQWITDIELTREAVYLIMQGGRSRWKVENETFNTLKNLGYNLEHNCGHGKNHLATVLATLMILAFLADQMQEHSCRLFKAARNKFYSRTALREKIRGIWLEFFIESWEDLWLSIIYGHRGGALQPDTS